MNYTIKGTVLSISNYNDGYFVLEDRVNHRELVCELAYKTIQWDLLYDYLTKDIQVEVIGSYLDKYIVVITE